MDLQFKISWSLIKKFQSCNRHFFYQYIEKAKQTDKVEDKYSRFGNSVHEVMENFIKFDTVDKAINHYYIKQKLFGEYSKEQVKNCIDYNFKVLDEIGKEVKCNEEVITLDYRGVKLKAIIDITFQDDSILDWKTSTFSTKSLKDYINQGKFYTWIKYLKTGKVPENFYLVFSKEGKYFQYSWSLDEIKEFEDWIFETINKIKNLKDFKDYEASPPRPCRFCPFKKKCASDSIRNPSEFKFFLRIENNKVFIDNEFIDPYLEEVLENQFSYKMDNAHFAIKSMRAKGNMEFDGIIRLYSKRNKSLPLGFLSHLKELLLGYGETKGKRVIIEEEDNRTVNPVFEHGIEKLNGVTLRPYQEEAVEYIMRNKHCITDICTGAGKTLIAAEVIRRADKVTLFVVDEKALLNQTKEVFENVLNVPIGTITNGEMITEAINICTIQTINSHLEYLYLKAKDKKNMDSSKLEKMKNKYNNFKELLDNVGLVIVDEAHGAKAKSYKKFLDNVNARMIVGITGTAFQDGNESLELYRNFGFPDFQIKANHLIEEGYLQAPEITFHTYDEDFIVNGNYEQIYNQILETNDRVSKIISLAKEHKNDKTLIIVSRIEFGAYVEGLLEENGISCEFIRGEVKASERTRIIQRMKDDDLSVIIGTSKIVQKGLDIPNLNVVINTTANLGSIFSIQSIGRILRKSPGKEKAYYHDFNDTHNKIQHHTVARINYFESQGYDVEVKGELKRKKKTILLSS